MPQGKQRSVDATRFAMVPRTDVPRSAFDVSFGHKTTFEAGFLIPVYLEEVLPGDSFRVRMTAFARLATPIVPIMDNLWLESFFFFVPNRLVWGQWERFMGEQLSPTDTTEFLIPQIPIVDADTVVGSLADYFGITVNNSGNTLNVSALPFRGYKLIYDDWFRDEDLQPRVTNAALFASDGPDASPGVGILRRGKRHDYFTTARPWPQKPAPNFSDSGVLGGPFVPGGRMIFPQAGAPVSGLGVADPPVGSAALADVLTSGARREDFDETLRSNVDAFVMKKQTLSNFPDVRVLINDIRTANAVQLMLERNARGGTRYSELVRAHFGVVSPDARLQRTEYLGGGRAAVTINPVAQTSESSVNGVLGELAGIGTALAHDHGFSSSFTEHGYVFGLVCVRADLSYQQGTNRMWFRRTQYDFFWPGLANLGEQAVLSKEIYSDGSVGDEAVWGYQERWSEYKYKPSMISGAFRSSSAAPLDVWHLSQFFANIGTGLPERPTLGPAFIVENPPVDRVLQVATTFGEQFLFDSMFGCRLVRAMPMHSIPGLGPRL